MARCRHFLQARLVANLILLVTYISSIARAPALFSSSLAGVQKCYTNLGQTRFIFFL